MNLFFFGWMDKSLLQGSPPKYEVAGDKLIVGGN